MKQPKLSFFAILSVILFSVTKTVAQEATKDITCSVGFNYGLGVSIESAQFLGASVELAMCSKRQHGTYLQTSSMPLLYRLKNMKYHR